MSDNKDKVVKVGSLVKLRKLEDGKILDSKIKQYGVVCSIDEEKETVSVMFKDKTFDWPKMLVEIVG